MAGIILRMRKKCMIMVCVCMFAMLSEPAYGMIRVPYLAYWPRVCVCKRVFSVPLIIALVMIF